jgi:hypothetical protein
MERKRFLQRGAADLVAVAAGLTILAVAVAGTSAALLYGRQALVNQEHYKAAVYLLRGELEQECARIQLSSDYRENPANLLSSRKIGEFQLDSPNDRNGTRRQTIMTISRPAVSEIYKPEVSLVAPVAYRIRMDATWTESAAAGVGPRSGPRNPQGETNEISLATSVFVRGVL